MVDTFADLSHKYRNVVTTKILIEKMSISLSTLSSFNDEKEYFSQKHLPVISVNTLNHEKRKKKFLILYTHIWFNMQV